MRATLALLSLSVSAASAIHDTAAIRSRNLVTSQNDISDSYDFVIVGGGLAGLVLGNRLSEDTNTTVLVLEAGKSGDEVASQIDTPSSTYYDSLSGSAYDWDFKTVAQANAANKVQTWPRGKTLGGSTSTNGMYLVHPDSYEVDLWASIAGDDENADRWKWDSLSEAVKKSSTFSAPSDDVAELAGIEYNADSHGTDGPVSWSYPGYEFAINGDWTKALGNVGVEANPDSASGTNLGAFVATSAINPSNWTRSSSRAAYLDPLPPRENFQVLSEAMVTRIVWDDSSDDSGLKATGVEFAKTQGGDKTTITVNREVILAGGAIGSPAVLMHSGVGPKDVLTAAGVDVKLDLPGVGQHVQDHIVTNMFFTAKGEDTAGDVHAAGNNDAEFNSYINSAIAYINITTILGDTAQDTIDQIKADKDSSVSNLVPSKDETVIEGYKTIYDATLQTLEQGTGQVELLLSITGANTVTIQAALQHSFSQGKIYIESDDPFTAPTIDPQYLSHWADKYILREALKFGKKLAETAPLSDYAGSMTYPSNVDSDEAWDTFVEESIATEYHPTGSSSMLPQDKGGVVDTRLKVYGTSNVRVVDSSVYPIELTCHLMTPTYGLTELGADMIRREYNLGDKGFGNFGSNSSDDGGNGGDSDGSGGSSDGSNSDDGGDGALSHLPSVAFVAAALALSASLFA